MSRAPTLSAALRAQGFHEAAKGLDRAADHDGEILAMRLALATIDGASHVLRTHARSLRNTCALATRVELRILEERLTDHLGGLLRRSNPMIAVARDVQDGGS